MQHFIGSQNSKRQKKSIESASLKLISHWPPHPGEAWVDHACNRSHPGLSHLG